MLCSCVCVCVFVGGAGESARSSGRISAAVSQTVYGGPGGAGREDERKVRDEHPSFHRSIFLHHINENDFQTYLTCSMYPFDPGGLNIVYLLATCVYLCLYEFMFIFACVL